MAKINKMILCISRLVFSAIINSSAEQNNDILLTQFRVFMYEFR